jgi:hypothetical protein
MVSKLQGVCRTQSYDPLRGLEITLGSKMSKFRTELLNLLLIYSLVQTEFLVAYVCIWQSTLSRIVVALVEMISSKFICFFWLR